MVLYPWKTTTPKRLLHVKLIEPPYTERYVRWCERSEGEIIAFLLLDLFRTLLKAKSQNHLADGWIVGVNEIKGLLGF